MSRPRNDNRWSNIVSQVSGAPLKVAGSRLLADDGTAYMIKDDVADIVDERLIDDALVSEQKVFDEIPLENICYFRQDVFMEATGILKSEMSGLNEKPVCVEIGGGEGYFAKAFLEEMNGATCYVCDLSIKHLKNADNRLVKIRCDARRPYLAQASVDVAAFWVSLHHMNSKDMKLAIATAVKTLKPGGRLLVFEPNDDFLPRNLFYKTSMSRNVYFDEEEKGLRYPAVAEVVRRYGMEKSFVASVNPPYNLAFLKHFRGWPFFYMVTRLLYLSGRFLRLLGGFWKPENCGESRLSLKPIMAGSYFLAVFRFR